jgi:hypothetical protein
MDVSFRGDPLARHVMPCIFGILPLDPQIWLWTRLHAATA